MLLTQLEYFVAVARERHFGRAAQACYISASALSESIRKLESELGVPLVHRGRTFQGLTPDGELVLVWAQRILANHRALSDELDAARDRLATRVRFGVIPSGVGYGARILSALSTAHPLTRTTLETGLTSEDIVRAIRRHEFDAGLIHPSAADGTDLLSRPLYDDCAYVVHHRDIGASDRGTITGTELSQLPLGLLEPHMRARQIFDAAMQDCGIEVQPRFEADSVEALIAFVRSGPWAAVVPESAVPAGGDLPGLVVARLVDPEVVTPIVLVRLADQPISPVAVAVDQAAARILGGR